MPRRLVAPLAPPEPVWHQTTAAPATEGPVRSGDPLRVGTTVQVGSSDSVLILTLLTTPTASALGCRRSSGSRGRAQRHSPDPSGYWWRSTGTRPDRGPCLVDQEDHQAPGHQQGRGGQEEHQEEVLGKGEGAEGWGGRVIFN